MIPPAPVIPPVRVSLPRDLRCAKCNYGVALDDPRLRCPMCGGMTWLGGRPSPFALSDDLREISERLKPDFDPTTARAKSAWKSAVASGEVPAHR